MSSDVDAKILLSAPQQVDVAQGQVQVNCVGPTGTTFATQLVAPNVPVQFGGGTPLPAGTYTVTAQGLDVNGNPLSNGGVVYPPVTASISVATDPTTAQVPIAINLQLS